MAVKTVLKRAALSLGSLLVFLVLLEVGLRIGGYWYPPKDEPIAIWNRIEDRDMRLGRGLHRTTPRQLWTPKPGALVPWGQEEDERVNAAGWRGPLVAEEKPPGVVRIATLGDSSTFGHSVPYRATYSAQLEALLREQGVNVEVIDAGVVGYTILQGIERYRALVRRYHPDIVIEAFGAVNEHHQADLNHTDREKIDKAMTAGGVCYQIAWWLRNESRAMHLAARVADALTGVTHEDRIHPFEKVRKIENQRLYAGSVEWRGVRRVPLEEFEAALLTLRDEVEGDGARLVLVSMPRKHSEEKQSPVLLEYTKVVERVAREQELPLVDGRALFGEVLAGGAREEQLFADAYHPKPKGHRLLALALAQKVSELLSGN